jgi:hypothetical protein
MTTTAITPTIADSRSLGIAIAMCITYRNALAIVPLVHATAWPFGQRLRPETQDTDGQAIVHRQAREGAASDLDPRPIEFSDHHVGSPTVGREVDRNARRREGLCRMQRAHHEADKDSAECDVDVGASKNALLHSRIFRHRALGLHEPS